MILTIPVSRMLIKVEDCFDQEQTKDVLLHIDAIVWWDEVHKKCHIGDSREGATKHVQFPCNANGQFNLDGTYSKEATGGVEMKVKCAKEM